MSWIDWAVVAVVVVASIVAGMAVVRLSSRHGAVSYFTSDRNLPWWAIAISNTATYQSGNGAFRDAAAHLWAGGQLAVVGKLDHVDAAGGDRLGADVAADADHDHRRVDHACAMAAGRLLSPARSTPWCVASASPCC